MFQRRRTALGALEFLVVGAMILVFALIVVPQLRLPPEDQRLTTAEYHLATIRAAIESYRQDHDGQLPAHDDRASLWASLITKTQPSGAIDPLGPCGGYLTEVLENPFSCSCKIETTFSRALESEDVARQETAGWFYNPQTGHIFLASDPGFDL